MFKFSLKILIFFTNVSAIFVTFNRLFLLPSYQKFLSLYFLTDLINKAQHWHWSSHISMCCILFPLDLKHLKIFKKKKSLEIMNLNITRLVYEPKNNQKMCVKFFWGNFVDLENFWNFPRIFHQKKIHLHRQ